MKAQRTKTRKSRRHLSRLDCNSLPQNLCSPQSQTHRKFHLHPHHLNKHHHNHILLLEAFHRNRMHHPKFHRLRKYRIHPCIDTFHSLLKL